MGFYATFIIGLLTNFVPDFFFNLEHSLVKDHVRPRHIHFRSNSLHRSKCLMEKTISFDGAINYILAATPTPLGKSNVNFSALALGLFLRPLLGVKMIVFMFLGSVLAIDTYLLVIKLVRGSVLGLTCVFVL